MRNYLIHGAGGIGCVVAARLAKAGQQVSVIARGDHLEAIQRHGLKMTGKTQGTFPIPAHAGPEEADINVGTIVLLAMKSNDTSAALDRAGNLYRDRPIVCFQNGVSNEALLIKRGLQAYGCTVMFGAGISAPGEVEHSAATNVAIGLWPTGVDTACEQIVADLVLAEMDAKIHPAISRHKWGKLILNLANAYLALIDLPTEEASCEEQDRFFVADLYQEADLVLNAAGVDVETIGKRDLAGKIERLRRPGAMDPTRPVEAGRSYASTWQDLDAKRGNVEVDHFNGTIVRLGEQVSIPTPLNRVLRDRCMDAAARYLTPGSETTASLRAAAESD